MNRDGTAHPTALLIGTTVAYFALDLVKRMVLYAQFGAERLDAYNASFAMVEAGVNILMLSGLSAVMMPMLATAKRDGGDELVAKFGSTVSLVTLLVLGGTAALGIVFAPRLLSLYGFAATPDGVLVVRIVFAVLPFFGVDKILRHLLEHRGRFGPPVVASFVQRVVFLAVVVTLAGSLGVIAAGVAAAAAALAAMGFLLAALVRAGARPAGLLSRRHPLVKRMLRLLLPLGIAGSFAQAPLIDGLFASYFGAGKLSLLQLAVGLYTVPVALFGVSVGTAVFPRMSEAGAADDRTALQVHVATALRRTLYFTLPAMLGLMALASPVVRVLFARGAFSHHEAAVAASALVGYSLGLAAAAVRPILARAVYAVNRFRAFIVVEIVTLVLNVSLNILFAVVLGWGIFGLAFSTAVSALVTTGLLWLLVRRVIGTGEMGGLWPAVCKMTGSATLTAGLCYGAWHFTAPVHEPATWLAALRLAAAIGFGAALYFAATCVLRLEEYDDVRGLVRKLFRRR